MKRVIKCVSLAISLVCLVLFLSFPVACLEYSNNAPSYISRGGNFYIEVRTSELGLCTLILPNNYQFNYISTFEGSDEIYNTYSSTLSGYVFTSNGQNYQLRFQAFNTPQYLRPNGISGNTWTDLTVNELVTSNGSILGSNGQKVYNVADSDKIIITILIVSVSLMLLLSFISYLFNRKGDR